MIRFQVLAAALTVTSTLAIANAASAQAPASPYPVQTAPAPTPDADSLANAMRRLASNPRDLDALLTAGELSLKVGDASGAAALFKRAEGVDPMNGRVRAGMARILVTQERPGEALRYFDQAVGFGVDPRSFAGDRGLAYDLIGENERAQRDYRVALKSGGSDASGDEVRRRYALSLGISGQQLKALEQIEPLTRRNDRAAWRARAFILAMTGDVASANAIATQMMPGAMAQGLGPFFTRLAALSPTDKAFAVHFGETHATPQRIADAKLTPALPVLGPDPDARVFVAAAPPPPEPTRGKRRRRESTPRVEVARAAPRVTPAPMATPGFGDAGAPSAAVVKTFRPVPSAPAATAPVQIASARPPAPQPAPRTTVGAERQQLSLLAAEARRGVLPTATTPTPRQARAPEASLPLAPSSASPPAAPPAIAAPPPSTIPAAPAGAAAAPPTPAPVQLAAAAPIRPAPVEVAAATSSAGSMPASAPITAVPSSVPTPPHASEDSILSRIVSGLSIPGYELGVGPAPQPEPAPETAPVAVAAAAGPPETPPQPTPPAPSEVAAATAAAKPVTATPRAPAKPIVVARREASKPVALDAARPTTAAARTARRRGAPEPVADEAPVQRTGRGSRTQLADATTDTPARTRTTRGKAAAEAADTKRTTRRGGVAKDEADEPATTRRGKRALAAKDDDTPAKGKVAKPAGDDAKGEPSRIWVQVAGGANEGDLGKAYSAVQSRTPALKGRAAYSTPLRATNRVVTGPFKTDAEARAFVNQLAKQGVSAFPFTSDKGQKMTRIPPK